MRNATRGVLRSNPTDSEAGLGPRMHGSGGASLKKEGVHAIIKIDAVTPEATTHVDSIRVSLWRSTSMSSPMLFQRSPVRICHPMYGGCSASRKYLIASQKGVEAPILLRGLERVRSTWPLWPETSPTALLGLEEALEAKSVHLGARINRMSAKEVARESMTYICNQ